MKIANHISRALSADLLTSSGSLALACDVVSRLHRRVSPRPAHVLPGPACTCISVCSSCTQERRRSGRRVATNSGKNPPLSQRVRGQSSRVHGGPCSSALLPTCTGCASRGGASPWRCVHSTRPAWPAAVRSPRHAARQRPKRVRGRPAARILASTQEKRRGRTRLSPAHRPHLPTQTRKGCMPVVAASTEYRASRSEEEWRSGLKTGGRGRRGTCFAAERRRASSACASAKTARTPRISRASTSRCTRNTRSSAVRHPTTRISCPCGESARRRCAG